MANANTDEIPTTCKYCQPIPGIASPSMCNLPINGILPIEANRIPNIGCSNFGSHPDQSQGHFSPGDFLVPRSLQSQGHFSPRDTLVPKTLQSQGHFSPRHFSPRDTLVPDTLVPDTLVPAFLACFGFYSDAMVLWMCVGVCAVLYLDFKAQKLDFKDLYSNWKLSEMVRNHQT